MFHLIGVGILVAALSCWAHGVMEKGTSTWKERFLVGNGKAAPHVYAIFVWSLGALLGERLAKNLVGTYCLAQPIEFALAVMLQCLFVIFLSSLLGAPILGFPEPLWVVPVGLLASFALVHWIFPDPTCAPVPSPLVYLSRK